MSVVKKPTMNACDKCGQLVPANNDAYRVAALINGQNPQECTVGRHLLPVADGDKVSCPGSPSVAQYVPDQPKDTRGGSYVYTTENEGRVRRALTELERIYGPMVSEGDVTVTAV